MKRITVTLVCIFFLCLQGIKAQQNHFIYIQTENKQPFYVKLDKKVLNSSVSGYLIIPRLKDGVYNLAVGFPKSEWPEQKLICQVDNKDLGYLLKNFGEKGWGLFNLQTMEIVMADKKDTNSNAPDETKADAFSTMLSTVVNDPSIKQTVPVKEESKKNTNDTKDPAPVSTTPVIKAAPVSAKSTITKSYANKRTDGYEIVYIDAVHGQDDTIRVLIPAEEDLPVQQKKEAAPEEPSAVNNSQIPVEPKPAVEKPADNLPEEKKAVSSKKEKRKKEEKFLPIEMPVPETKPEENKVEPQTETKKDNSSVDLKKEELIPAEPAEKRPVIANSDCKNLASEEDFLKLRKKMASENTEEGMVSLAKKSFKSRCFTTEQIKNLAVLFLKDAGKYNFFDLAYPYVSDSQNYPTLESQLTDSYYISRFKAMIRH